MEEGHILTYDWARGLHIIAVIAWMAGTIMLPRYYAYITSSQPGGELETAMLKAARNLRFIIIGPSMTLTWVFGIYLFVNFLAGDWDRPFMDVMAGVPHWFWAKFILVLGLSGFHGFLSAQGKKLEKGQRKYSERFWRIASEAPFIVAIIVVLLVTVEP